MKASDFTRDDCLVGARRRTYQELTREWRCGYCGGRLVMAFGADWFVRCGHCYASDHFIHECELERQKAEGAEVLEGLPAELLARI